MVKIGDSLKQLVSVLVLSRLDYCNALLAGLLGQPSHYCNGCRMLPLVSYLVFHHASLSARHWQNYTSCPLYTALNLRSCFWCSWCKTVAAQHISLQQWCVYVTTHLISYSVPLIKLATSFHGLRWNLTSRAFSIWNALSLCTICWLL